MKGKIAIGGLSFISLLCSVSIYTDLRGYEAGAFGLSQKLIPIDISGFEMANSSAQHFVLYQLPDFLWMYAFALVIVLIWQMKFSKGFFLWLTAALFAGLGYELLQLTAVVDGTFDIGDLASTFAAFLLSLFTLLIVKKIL